VKLPRAAVGLVLLPLLLAGCTANAVPTATRTVTVTATPPTPTQQPGDAAPWDLHAVCAAEAEVSTLEAWRSDQEAAGKLDSRKAAAITQGIAVQYLEMQEFTHDSPAQREVDALGTASGSLDRPGIDLSSTAVRTARTGLAQTCRDHGLTIGVYAQGG
jgi:hypothetical protein